MAQMNPPNSDAVVNVRDEDVDRYAEAGWTKASGEKLSASKRTSSRK